MAYLLLGICVIGLFLLSLMNIQIGMYEEAAAYGITGFLLLSFTLIYLFAIKPVNENAARDKFLEWLFENEKEVLNTGASYKGDMITIDTQLIQYCIVYSAVILTKKDFSNYCVKGSNRSIRVGILSTLFNSIAGWWGIPWGFIYTPQSLYINLAKTMSCSVADVLDNKPI